jgi:kynurenine formamidase
MCLPGTVEAVRARDEQERETRVDRRAVLLGAAGAAMAATFPASALAGRDGRGHGHGRRRHTQDLTHTFRAGFPIYGTPPTFHPPSRRTVVNIVPDGFYGQEWTFWEHSATHMDAPGHFIAGGRFTPEITLRELTLPLFVVDIRRKAASNPDAAVSVDDIRRAERKHGRVPKGALVAMDSGWDRRAGSAAEFRNPDSSGVLHFPGFSGEATEWLIDHRRIGALGVDTLSLDPGNSTTFDTHITLLASDRYGLEGLANLGKVKPNGARASVGVIPWEQGSGGPARVWASW